MKIVDRLSRYGNEQYLDEGGRAAIRQAVATIDRLTAERDALKIHLDAAKKETVKWMEVAEEWHKAALAVSDADGGTRG